jgi:hypothetical protein
MAANPRVARGLVWEAAERMEKRRRLGVYRTQWALGCIVWVWTLLAVGLRSMGLWPKMTCFGNSLITAFAKLNALFALELKVSILFY